MKIVVKQCVLYDRICNNCGECEYCDINPLKKCDNCGKCIDSDGEFREIKIDAVIGGAAAGEPDIDIESKTD